MELRDLLTMIMLMPGFLWATAMYILLKRKKLKAKVLPRIFAIGAGVYMLVGSMIFSIFLEPRSKFANYTITNIFWSLAFGMIGYIGGRRLARNMPD